MIKRLREAWTKDRLGALAVASAVLALSLWVLPVYGAYLCDIGLDKLEQIQIGECKFVSEIDGAWAFEATFNPPAWNWFTPYRLPFIVTAFAIAIFLLLLRRSSTQVKGRRR